VPGMALGVLGNMTGITNGLTAAFNNTNSPPSFMGNEGNNGVLNGLAGMYAANRGYRDSQGMLEGLQGLYSQDSPYSQMLRQQLQRKDAAGGRRSQYGPREVELQARLAQMASNQIPAMNQLSQRANMNRAIMLQQGLGAFNSMGGMNYLRDLFRGPSALSQMPSQIQGLGNIFSDFAMPDIPLPNFGG